MSVDVFMCFKLTTYLSNLVNNKILKRFIKEEQAVNIKKAQDIQEK